VSGIISERQSLFTGFNRSPADACEELSHAFSSCGYRDMQSKSALQLRRKNQNSLFEWRPRNNGGFGRGIVVFFYLVLFFSFFSGQGLAVDFHGSDPLGSTGLTVAPGVDLLNTDQFYLTQVFANPGTGDFATVSYFMILTPEAEDWLIDFSDLSGLSIGNESFGTFMTTSSEVVARSPDFVTAELTGLFDNALVDDTAATLHFAMTQTGQSISWSGTLAVGLDAVPNVVPEPNAGVFGIVGFLSLILLTQRRRQK